jgi:hypothetical protein
MVYIGCVVNKSDLTDKRDLTGLSLVGQEKNAAEKIRWVLARKIRREKAAANATAVYFLAYNQRRNGK